MARNRQRVEQEGDGEDEAEASQETDRLLGTGEQELDEEQNQRRNQWVRVALGLIALVVLVLTAVVAAKATRGYVHRALVMDLESVHVRETYPDEMMVLADVSVRAGLDESTKRPFYAGTVLGVVKQMTTHPSLVDIQCDGVSVARAALPKMNVQLHGLHLYNVSTYVQITDLGQVKQTVRAVLAQQQTHVQVQATSNFHAEHGFLSVHDTITRTYNLSLSQMQQQPDINDLQVHDKSNGVLAEAKVLVPLEIPIQASVPAMQWSVAIPSCDGGLVDVATAYTQPLALQRNRPVVLDVSAEISHMPKQLIRQCRSGQTPLDSIVAGFLGDGHPSFYVTSKPLDPKNISFYERLARHIDLPVPVFGIGQSDSLVKNIQIEQLGIDLTKQDTNNEMINVSGRVSAVVELPDGIDLSVHVQQLLPEFELLYDGHSLGSVEHSGWIPAESRRISPTAYNVSAVFHNQQARILDRAAVRTMLDRLLHGKEGAIEVAIKGTAGVSAETAIGQIRLNRVPAQGSFSVPGFEVGQFTPEIISFRVLEDPDAANSLSVLATVAIVNPTNDALAVPFASVMVMHDDLAIAQVSAKQLYISSGENTVTSLVQFAPWVFSGGEGQRAAEGLISDYLSDRPTEVTVQVTENSLPSHPGLSHALSGMSVSLPAPRIFNSTKDLIRDSTFHILSSSAQFVLANPLNVPIIVNHVNATARYNGSDIGYLTYDMPIILQPAPAETTTPNLPVEWDIQGGLQIVREALGGSLQVDSIAHLEFNVGRLQHEMAIDLDTHGVGAKIRL